MIVGLFIIYSIDIDSNIGLKYPSDINNAVALKPGIIWVKAIKYPIKINIK